MKKILFVSYGGGHVNSLLPVAERMKSNGYDVTFFALTSAINTLAKSTLRYYTYSNFFDVDEVRRAGKFLIHAIETNILPTRESLIYLGRNYLDLVSEVGHKKAEELYAKTGRMAFNPKRSMSEVLLRLQPDVVVTTSSPRSEKAIVYAAGELGIKSLVLSDLFVERPLSWFSDPKFGSKICVPSNFAKDILISNGRPSNDIIVTGNPAFDKLVSISNKLKNPENYTYRVLWASQPEPKYFLETNASSDPLLPVKIEAELIRIFRTRPKWKLIVRNHPNEESREYPDFVEISNKNEELSVLLKSIDLVISCTSIVGFEALILGKAYMTVNVSVLTPMLPFSKYGYSIGVNSIENLEKSLLDFFSRNHEARSCYKISDATKAVCDAISIL